MHRATATTNVGGTVSIGELGAGETWMSTLRFGHFSSDQPGAYRLAFKAHAWNANAASASVLLRTAGAGDRDVPEVEAPANDRFAETARIMGTEGAHTFDLLAAMVEPGEPAFSSFEGRPAGSVWFEWTAPEDGPVSFGVTPASASLTSERVRVSAYQGETIADLARKSHH